AQAGDERLPPLGARARRRGAGCSPTPLRRWRLSGRRESLGDGLLQGGASGHLDAVTGRNLDLLTGTGVAAGARSALHPLDAQQAGDLDGLALAEGLVQDLLQRTQRGVGVGLGQRRLLGDRSNEISAVDGHVSSLSSFLIASRAGGAVVTLRRRSLR